MPENTRQNIIKEQQPKTYPLVQPTMPSTKRDSFTGNREEVNENVSTVTNPKTNEKKYFVNSQINNVNAKSWDEMNFLEKFTATTNEADIIGRSIAGERSLGAVAKGLDTMAWMSKAIDSSTGVPQAINTVQRIEKFLTGAEKFSGMFDKRTTASQVLSQFANKIRDYKEKEFPTTYSNEDLTFKNLPKLLLKPDFVLNSLGNIVETGLIWKGGGTAGLWALESGDILSARRAKAILRGEKEETMGEFLYASGMGLFNAWIENFTFKVMTGAGKVPLADKLIEKISNNLIKNIASWGTKVATEMGEEFVQEGLPILVASALFKEEGDTRNFLKRVVD
jgi:hypothetical protein